MQTILNNPCRRVFTLYQSSFNSCNVFTAKNSFNISSRNFCVSNMSLARPSVVLYAVQVPRMKQVEVDELDVQKKLGQINMDFVRKAEKRNKKRASMHRFFRRKDWLIAAFCFSLVIGIYSYTIFAIQQEKFLDDFEMPEDIDRTQEQKK